MGTRAKFSSLASIGVGHLGQLVKRLTGTAGAARLSSTANHINLTSPIVAVTGTISAEAATAADQRNRIDLRNFPNAVRIGGTRLGRLVRACPW